MSILFEMKTIERREKSTEILGKLIKSEFLSLHKNYIVSHYNGINDNVKYEQFNARIKALYKRFVLDENWDEADFVNVLDLSCTLHKNLDNVSFRDTLTDYKAGLYDYLYEDDEDLEL